MADHFALLANFSPNTEVSFFLFQNTQIEIEEREVLIRTDKPISGRRSNKNHVKKG